MRPVDVEQDDRISSEVWAALREATPEIVEHLAGHGIVGASYVVGFLHPYGVHVWLATATDAARDRIAGPDPFLAVVRGVLARSEVLVAHATIDGTVVESQETVDRDDQGSWWHAQR